MYLHIDKQKGYGVYILIIGCKNISNHTLLTMKFQKSQNSSSSSKWAIVFLRFIGEQGTLHLTPL